MPRSCPEGFPHKHPASVTEAFYWLCMGMVVGAHEAAYRIRQQRKG